MERLKRNDLWNLFYLAGVMLFVASLSATSPELKSRFLPMDSLVSVSVIQKSVAPSPPTFFVRWKLLIWG